MINHVRFCHILYYGFSRFLQPYFYRTASFTFIFSAMMARNQVHAILHVRFLLGKDFSINWNCFWILSQCYRDQSFWIFFPPMKPINVLFRINYMANIISESTVEKWRNKEKDQKLTRSTLCIRIQKIYGSYNMGTISRSNSTLTLQKENVP